MFEKEEERGRGEDFISFHFKHKIRDENLGLSSENPSHIILHQIRIPQQEDENRTCF